MVCAGPWTKISGPEEEAGGPSGACHGSLRANISETIIVLLIADQGEKEKRNDEREFPCC